MHVVQIPRRFVRHEWGGTETVVLETCQRLPQFGVTTEIVCPNALATENDETIAGIAVRRYPYFYPYWGLAPGAHEALDKKGGNLFSFALRSALLRQPQLDLIHLHTMNRLGGIARQVAQRRRIPYIVSLHGGAFDVPAEEAATWTEPTRGAFEWGKALGYWVGSHRVLADAAAVVCVGKKEQQATQQRYPDQRVEWLPNGVDTRRFAQGDRARFRREYHLPDSAFVLLSVARIDPQKNQLLAIQALAELLPRVPEAHLLLIGAVTSPSYRQTLEAEAEQLGLTERVTILPGLAPEAIPDAYHAADVFVLPSRHEPFGIVVLEAWAAGLPVVASAVGGIIDLVEPGRTGFLFAPDALCELVQGVVGVHDLRPEHRTHLAATAREHVCAHYDWDSVTQRLAQLYASCI